MSLSPQDWDVEAYRSVIGHTHFNEVMYTEQGAVHSALCTVSPVCVSSKTYPPEEHFEGRQSATVCVRECVRKKIHPPQFSNITPRIE